jgi:hypothetical protein
MKTSLIPVCPAACRKLVNKTYKAAVPGLQLTLVSAAR